MGWALGGAILAAAIDLASKAWAHRYVPAGFGPASDGFVQLRWITNRGAALGLGAGHPLVVAGIAVLSTLVVGWWLSRTVSSGERFAVAIVLGGALGNLGDRLAHGAVTDWVHVAAYPATFNVADVCIRVGIIIALTLRALHHRAAARGLVAGAIRSPVVVHRT